MYKEFEAKSEDEARRKAIEELGLEGKDFDVEVIEIKKGLFKKSVKIGVHWEDPESHETEVKEMKVEETISETAPVKAEGREGEIVDYLKTLISKMGYEAEVTIMSREEGKLFLDISSRNSPVIIGRGGKTLDSLQLLVNVFAGEKGEEARVILDVENYRLRHEENIVRSALRSAERVRSSGRSFLLEPMNPFERRLVHTALNDFEGVETKSEGEGVIKRVRIIPLKR